MLFLTIDKIIVLFRLKTVAVYCDNSPLILGVIFSTLYSKSFHTTTYEYVTVVSYFLKDHILFDDINLRL
ncbi:hypothetical protein SC1000_09030 [Aggregatibacter actinomycetemcomitans]|nr:hypothetical protein SC1000_09030 [Aggregatibacter actinomycetemcomitans]